MNAEEFDRLFDEDVDMSDHLASRREDQGLTGRGRQDGRGGYGGGRRTAEASPAHGELEPEIERSVLAWAALNADALLAYYTGELDTVKLEGRLRRLEG